MKKNLDLQAAYRQASEAAYKGIYKRVVAASQSLNLLAMAVHHREAIFGDDAEKVGTAIVASFTAADILTKGIQDSLTYAHFFDASPDKDAARDQALDAGIETVNKIRKVLKDLNTNAQTNKIVDDFLPSPETTNPKADFAGAFQGAIDEINSIRDCVESEAHSMKELVQSLEAMPKELKPITFPYAHCANTYAGICDAQAKEMAEILVQMKVTKLEL